MNSIPGPSTSLEVAETPKLPLEIVGMIMLIFDDEERLEELKNCRLISPRWYKGIQDLYRDEFYQKYISHFDGSKQTFASSRSFGYNIFGDYKLNHATLKISNSDQHLLETFMRKLITTNLQTLELQNNLLNLEEIIQILSKFQNLLHFKYIQGSEDMNMAYQIAKLFPIYDKDQIRIGDLKNIKALVKKHENFLPKLVSFEVKMIHMKILNLLSYIISCAECSLESFSVKIDFEGVASSSTLPLRVKDIRLLGLRSFDYFSKFSKSLKKIEIIVDKSSAPINFPVYSNMTKKYFDATYVLDTIISDLFGYQKLKKFKSIEELIISLATFPYIDLTIFSEDARRKNPRSNIMSLVKSQANLKRNQIFMIRDQYYNDFPYINQMVFFNSTRVFLTCLKNGCSESFQFGYLLHHLDESPSVLKLLEFSENLAKIEIDIKDETYWPLAHEEIPIFPNCIEMKYILGFKMIERSYQIPSIVQKFPNLEKLIIVCCKHRVLSVTNEELQLIIHQYENLKELHFINSSQNLRDYGLTGLTAEALRTRSTNPDLPILPEEQIGLPISHLKSLESFTICFEDCPTNSEISDLSVKFGFEGMKNLRKLQLMNTKITPEGFSVLKEKTGSKNLIII